MAKKSGNDVKNVNEKFLRELNVSVRSSLPIIQINTMEESRVDNIIGQLLMTNNVDECFEWSCTTGFVEMKTKKSVNENAADPKTCMKFIKDELIKKINKLNSPDAGNLPAKDPANKIRFYILRDISPFFTNPIYVRFLREIAKLMPTTLDRIIITNPISKVPQELETDITRIDLDFPKDDEISEILEECLTLTDNFQNYVKTPEQKQKVISACLGLSKTEIEGSICKALYEYHLALKDFKDGKIKKQPREVYEHVLDYKAGIVKKNGILEYIIPDANAGDVGGLEILKDWLILRSNSYSPEAKAYGIPTPKGAILLGIPGTGKSLCAKAAASILGVPLIRLDVGKVFGSLVGESESKMQTVIKTLEAIGTAILFIDEMDKAFAGVGGSGSGDSGTSKRVFGTFLTWLQEKKANIFVLATVNDCTNFPPELLRKGRFDEIFYVGLPSTKDRKEIFKIHIEKKNRNANNYDLDSLAKATNEFTGAEIESVVNSAMYRAFYDKQREFTTNDLLIEAESTNPMAVGMKDAITYQVNWAKKNAKFASSPEDMNVEINKNEGIADVSGKGRKMSIAE